MARNALRDAARVVAAFVAAHVAAFVAGLPPRVVQRIAGLRALPLVTGVYLILVVL